MRILVTGGAGYVGSHTASLLCKEGYEIIILDDLSTGHKWALKGEEFIEGSLLDESLLNNVFKERNINKVMHFAAKSIVSESEENPTLYFQNNVSGSINLFKAMLKHKVNDIVFSSSAAVYGEPVNQEISEDQTKRPINIYGKTKLIIENLLMDLYKKEGLNSISLRYFNAAGACPEEGLGEAHKVETHLIPNIFNSLIKPDGKSLKVFGNDYSTKDGTCIRDYIHVKDLANGHLQSINFLNQNPGCKAYNLGSGKGFSVSEIINKVTEITGKEVKFDFEDRRDGAPAILLASIKKIKNEIGWEPIYSSLDKILLDAYGWHIKYNEQ